MPKIKSNIEKKIYPLSITKRCSYCLTCVVGLAHCVTVFAQSTVNTMYQQGLASTGQVGANGAGDGGARALRTVVPRGTVVTVRLTNRILFCGCQQAVVTGHTLASRGGQSYN